MIHFSEFEDTVQDYILVVLFFMPWASAQNIADLGPWSVQHVRRHLRVLEHGEHVVGAPAAKALGRARRFVLTPDGVNRTRALRADMPAFPYSADDLIWLFANVETLAVVYAKAPRFWTDSGEEELRAGASIRNYALYEANRVVDAWELREARFDGFIWCMCAHIIALAIFKIPDSTQEVVVPILEYGMEHQQIPDGPAFFSGVQFHTYVDAPRLGAPVEERANPMTVMALVTDGFAASCLARNSSGLPVVPFDKDGNRLRRMTLREQQGEYAHPYVNKRGGDQWEELRELMREIREGGLDDLLMIGQLEMRIWRLVHLWCAVRHSDAVQHLGRTNGTRISQAFAKLENDGWISELNGIYYVADFGIRVKAYQERVSEGQVRQQFGFLLNRNGKMSRRTLRRSARVTQIGLLLQRCGVATAHGRRADIAVLDRSYEELGPYFPDLYVATTTRGHQRWSALEFADCDPNRHSALERLQIHISASKWWRRWQDGDPVPVFVVAETPAIEAAIWAVAAEAELPIGTTLLAEVVARCGSGADPEWRLQVPDGRRPPQENLGVRHPDAPVQGAAQQLDAGSRPEAPAQPEPRTSPVQRALRSIFG